MNNCTSELDIKCMGGECLNHWRESSGKPCMHFAQLYLRNGINEQKKSIATGPFYVRNEFEPI